MIDALLLNCYNNYMGLVRKSSKIALTSIVIAGIFMSSCAEMQGSSSGGGIVKKVKDGIKDAIHDVEKGAHKAWDYLTGKQPKWKREKAGSDIKAVANWPQTLTNVNVKGLPPKVQRCYKDASALSGVPIQVMYAITMNETGFYPADVLANDGLEGNSWDCGIMQDNTYWQICPLAYRLYSHVAVYTSQYDRQYSALLSEIKALGLKYFGGGSSGYDCVHLNHQETVDYCRSLDETPLRIGRPGRHYVFKDYGSPLTSNPVCLGVFISAYVLSKYMWEITHSSYEYNKVIRYMKADDDGAYEYALQHAGPYFKWTMVAYSYNSLMHCYGAACYYNRFLRHLHEVESGIIHVSKALWNVM